MDLIKKVRLNDPNAQVILTTSFPPSSAVIEAMRLGAYDVLRKETLPYDLRPIVEEALKAGDEIKSTAENSDKANKKDTTDESIIGRSSAMQDVFKMIGRASRGDAPVLITGESGAGKRSLQEPFTNSAKDRVVNLLQSTVQLYPKIFLNQNYLATKKDHSLVHTHYEKEGSNNAMGGLYFWMKSVICQFIHKAKY